MDWDGDGRLDIIVGDRPGQVHFFKRLSFGNIYMEEQDLVTLAGKPIDIDYNAAPSVFDWNGDGLPDLVIGALNPIPSGLYLLINEGAPYQPDYQRADTVLYQGEPIELATAYPDFHDMTGDGLEDLILGSSNGRVGCYVNSGTPGDPLFEYMENVQADGEELYIISYVRPTVCDWNDDGTPDLLVADYQGWIHIYTGIPQSGIEPGPAAPVIAVENPVRGEISLRVQLPEPQTLSVELRSLEGRLVRSIDSIYLQGGSGDLTVQAADLPSGCYLLSVSTPSGTALRTVAVLR